MHGEADRIPAEVPEDDARRGVRLAADRPPHLRKAALQPGEAYLLARRSVLNQVRLRSAIELLHAADETAPGCSRVSWQVPSPNTVTHV